MEVTKFSPAPGIILVDPLLKTRKSDMMAVNDTVDDPHRGVVVYVGPAKPYESNPSKVMIPPCSPGDNILYSIAGCEKTRLEYKGDLRHEFAVVPFSRFLGVFNE